MRNREISSLLMPFLAAVLMILGWQLYVRLFNVEKFVLPPPGDVLSASTDAPGELWEHSLVTLREVLVGFVISVAIGVVLGLLIAASQYLRDAIYPLILVTQSVPKVALAPVLLLALGYGEAPKIVIVFLVCFFPIVINTAAGLESTPHEHLLLARSLRANRWTTFWKFRVPGALPFMFVGFKLAISLAVIGAVIGEFVGGDAGLGYLIVVSTSHANTGLAYGSIVLLGAISIVLFYGIVSLEMLVTPWRRRAR